MFSNQERSFVKSPIPNDFWGRLYWSEEGANPQYKTKTGQYFYPLGIPIPDTPPILHQLSTKGDQTDSLQTEDRVYIYTYTNEHGMEGPPSEPLLVTSVGPNTDVSPLLIRLTFDTPSGAGAWGEGSKVNIYRSSTGSTTSAFLFVGSVTKTGGSMQEYFDDTIESQYLQEELLSAEWVGPPDLDTARFPDGPLVGLTDIGNGVLAGWTGKTVCFSFPYQPHAWPAAYQYSVMHDIRGLVSLPSGVLILTSAKPYMAFGNDPSAMGIVPLDSAQACVSRHSVVDMGDYAMYASQDGLCVADGRTVEVISRPLVDEQEWRRAWRHQDYRAFLYEGMYIAFYEYGDGFLFDPKGGRNALVKISGIHVTAGWYEPDNDALWLHVVTQGVGRYGRMGEGAALEANWQTKDYYLSRHECFNWLHFKGDFTTCRYTVYADKEPLDTGLLRDETPIRVPSGNRFQLWSVKFTGTDFLLEDACMASCTSQLE